MANKDARIIISVEPELKRQLKVMADSTGLSLSTFINILLQNAVGMVGSTFATMGATMEGLHQTDKGAGDVE